MSGNEGLAWLLQQGEVATLIHSFTITVNRDNGTHYVQDPGMPLIGTGFSGQSFQGTGLTTTKCKDYKQCTM